MCILCKTPLHGKLSTKKNLTPTCQNCKGSHRADIRSAECNYLKKNSDSNKSNSKATTSQENSNTNTSTYILTQRNFPNLRSNRTIPNIQSRKPNHKPA